MLISPPFLPAPTAGESDSDWIARAMPVPVDCAVGTYAPEGSFPVSSYLQWHNGVHCTAPVEDGRHLPVCAVADGTIVFVAQPAPHSEDPAHPLNYPLGTRDGWTDNGCVAVRHTTAIGAAGGLPTRITFFSLSMHLRTLADRSSDAKGKAAPWKVGDRVYRKDVLGEAGRIMGAKGRLHFEIFCDEANLQTLIGRPAKWAEDEPFAAPQADGRTDAVFGSMFVYLPGTTPTSATLPGDPVRRPSGLQLGADRWVEIRYDGGSSFVSSRDASGQPVGVAPFAPLKVADFEYDMYKRAIDLHAAYLARGGSRPSSPSGWYELLRFGRNLGPDPLPADAAHWREIPAAGGSIWVDLNAAGTFKFSEADFLPATGWNCFGDDPTPDDQRCDSIELKRLIRDRDPQNPQRMTRDALCRRIAKPSVRSRLRKAICRFPSEWDRSTMLKRYEWIRGLDETFEMDKPENWERFVRHCETLTFPDLPQEVKDATWRFHPVEFISVMRRCGWLGIEELAQLVPAAALRVGKNKSNGAVGYMWEDIPVQNRTAQNRFLIDHYSSLNRTTRKYGIISPLRQACFFGNAVQETLWLRSAVELGGTSYWYSPWHGRGFLQLTHSENYFSYWLWRGRSFSPALRLALNQASILEGKKTPPLRRTGAIADVNFPDMTQQITDWRQHIEGTSTIGSQFEASFAPADSAGFYWISLRTNMRADSPHHLERIAVKTVNGSGQKIYYRSQSFWNTAATVNLPSKIGHTNFAGLNGFEPRCGAYTRALQILSEIRFPDVSGIARLPMPE
ncbi:MAG: hypothetical protein EOP57_00050 [Sphingomonadales bacterium]|nr:MAG: hypothetical protein EOP57_00050 [Sphingomonadales bacterium]